MRFSTKSLPNRTVVLVTFDYIHVSFLYVRWPFEYCSWQLTYLFFWGVALEVGSSTQWRRVNKGPQTFGIEARSTRLLQFLLHGLYQSRSGQISQPGVLPLDVEKDENLQHNSGISSPFAFKQEQIKEG